ncbi:hypothetical protein [Methanosarcina sp. 2.H.A.1B.4]|uniref:hypothetical protein n=1 Tax=Methanosarcina sp. 2.H.A.1B.4 TaxID=1483600 RepID=UPI0012E0BD54|nr:hypothetical protein [Methanosarcina sp. 2.H.A.1B.4]
MVYEKNRKRKENERWKEYETRTENERRRMKNILPVRKTKAAGKGMILAASGILPVRT